MKQKFYMVVIMGLIVEVFRLYQDQKLAFLSMSQSIRERNNF